MKIVGRFAVAAMLTVLPSAALAQSPAPASPASAPSLTTVSGGLTRVYRAARRNLIEAAELMPEQDYGFRPADGIRTFGEMVGHLATSSYSFCAAALDTTSPDGRNHEKLATKAELLAALQASLKFCDTAYDTLTDETIGAPASLGPTTITRSMALTLNAAHQNEHYGNMVTFLRIKGLVPPSTARTIRR